MTDIDKAQMRQWLRENGFTPGDRGRFSAPMILAWNGAFPSSPYPLPKSVQPTLTVEKLRSVVPSPEDEEIEDSDEQPDDSDVPDANYSSLVLAPEQGRVTAHEMTINGRNVEVNTELSIKGERGRFRFKMLVRTPTDEWITVYGGPKGHNTCRSFHPSRVKTVHRIAKARPA